MISTRHEEYNSFKEGLPFVLNANINRSAFNLSKENNWHENLEIQICTDGNGSVLLDGEKYPFSKNDIIVVNSNVIHYTGTNENLTYDCIIISTEFCKQLGINPNATNFKPFINNPMIIELLYKLKECYFNDTSVLRIAKLNKLIIQILIEFLENHTIKETKFTIESKRFETVKKVITFIRKNYKTKTTLDEISKAVLCDKYKLCRDFKALTGQTIIENLNNYRCIKATDYLISGYSVTETAELCGFDNLSFFTKTFKKYIGKLPSEYKT